MNNRAPAPVSSEVRIFSLLRSTAPCECPPAALGSAAWRKSRDREGKVCTQEPPGVVHKHVHRLSPGLELDSAGTQQSESSISVSGPSALQVRTINPGGLVPRNSAGKACGIAWSSARTQIRLLLFLVFTVLGMEPRALDKPGTCYY